VILIISGIGYTLVGIKNKWLHIYLSAAYLASLAVTVLIMYVMNPPVSNAIQGAYVVAVAMTGLILGGAAIVFTEMTEGLGCLLGGFCFSMWLLVLKPGGLLTATSSKSIFIAAFTLAVFATSFSHYTRPYGLIVSISFGGATVVVLGIDCFSRAGLKEYWAYLWDLNSNLFPLGATSYPLTRGIRVEVAAIVIIFLAGIVSQSKLWKVIKQRREQRTAERLQDERNMEQEEENVGKRIEHANAEERNQWEAVYGDKDAIRSGPSRRDSGVADSDSQKKGPISTVTTLRQSREDEIEMSEIPSPALTGGAGLVLTNNGQDGGPVTVRVARDLEPPPDLDENGNPLERDPNRNSHLSTRSQQKQEQEQEQEMIWVVGADGEARFERRPSKRNSKRASNPVVGQAPDIVPLPFKVPEGEVEDDRSSVATFADEEQAGQKRRAKHLSAGSMLMRKLSQRSQRLSKGYSIGQGPSTEDLVVPHAIADDQSSIAATMDGLSDDEDMRSIRSSMHQVPDTTEATRVQEEPVAPESEVNTQLEAVTLSAQPVKLDIPESDKSRRESAMTVATAILDTEPIKDQPEKTTEKSEEIIENSVVQQSLTSSTDPKQKTESAPDADKEKTAPSAVSAVESKPASITKDRLPAQLSRVVMSYRTNEWAKHLSNADAPEVDELKLGEYRVEDRTVLEVAAPVNMEELSQTPQNAIPPLASRTVSQMSNHVPSPLTRSSSAQSKTHPSRPETSNGVYPQDTTLLRSMSQQSLPSQMSQQNMVPRGFRSSSSPHIPQPIVESPIEEEFPSTAPNYPSTNKFSPHPNIPFGTAPTLIGKRDSMLRSKTSYFSNPSTLPSTPEFPMQFPIQQQQYSSPPSHAGSDAGSLYNYPNTNAIHEDDNMSLSARRDLIQQSSLQQLSSPVAHLQQTPIPFDSHQPRRQSSTPSPAVREQQLASWRASVQHDLQSAVVPKNTIERQRSALWQERQQDEQRRAIEERRRGERDSAFDERMRRGDMLDAHREALRKMQATANRHAS
jgi:hypothetical protein